MSTNPSRASALAFVVAFTTLTSQVLFHRVISAKLMNNYAFLVISLTMLGFACSGALLSRSLRAWNERFEAMMGLWASLFVVSTLGATFVFYHVGTGSPFFESRAEFIARLLKSLPFALLFAVPFVFAGLLLGLLLSSPKLPSRQVYCWDLLGSGLGAIMVTFGIRSWGVENTLLAVCALLLASVLLLARPDTRTLRWAAGAFTLLAVAAVFHKPFFTLRFPEGTMLAPSQRPGSRLAVEYIEWDPVARIEVTRIPPPDPAQTAFPALIGSNTVFHSRFKRVITQNNFAFTYAVEYDGRPQSLAGIEQTIYSTAYAAGAQPKPRVAVIGVGGGFDILTALHYDASSIVGIEVNGATLHILTNKYADYFKAWTSDPRVKLVHEEGRHFLASSQEKFDIIQLSGVDTYSGTPGAAHVFSESYLYTSEAFELYFSRLSDQGILNFIRLEHTPPREMLRTLTTAVAGLRKAGVRDPAKHIAMMSARNKRLVSLMVKKTPFTQLEEQNLTRWADTNPYLEVAVLPGSKPDSKNFYQTFLGLANPEAERAYYGIVPYNVAPTVDDNPFFFNFSRWSHLFTSVPLLQATVPVMEITLIIMFCLVLAVALACVWLPLRSLLQAEQSPTPRRYGFIFAGTAIAYLAIEVGLLQKFGLYLGHPNYALSIVLAGLLIGTGIGSMVSADLCRWFNGPRFIAYALALLTIFEVLVAMPALKRWQVDAFWLRAAMVLALVMPLGALMGTFVPTALEQLKTSAPGFVPWAWGVNGVFSVLAPVLSIAFSMTWGIDALLLGALPIYILVGWLYPPQSASAIAEAAKP